MDYAIDLCGCLVPALNSYGKQFSAAFSVVGNDWSVLEPTDASVICGRCELCVPTFRHPAELAREMVWFVLPAIGVCAVGAAGTERYAPMWKMVVARKEMARKSRWQQRLLWDVGEQNPMIEVLFSGQLEERTEAGGKESWILHVVDHDNPLELAEKHTCGGIMRFDAL